MNDLACSKIKPILLGLLISVFCCLAITTNACTIFVLTNENKTLFGNNEDYSNPLTRIWFVPEGEDYFGTVYVGFDNGWAQGGMNTEGLSFDWVTGFEEPNWRPAANAAVLGNPAERMLETSRNIEDAIQYFRTHPEKSFSASKILVADKSGDSAIIGSKNGQLHVDRSGDSRGFGYCGHQLHRLLLKQSEATIENGFNILSQCKQDGENATKYSNIYDLKILDIHVAVLKPTKNHVTLNLLAELNKGGHYYDIPKLRQQLNEPIKPLLNNMKRLYITSLVSAPKQDRGFEKRIRRIINQMRNGEISKYEYSSQFSREISKQTPNELRAQAAQLGELMSMSLIEQQVIDNRRILLYRLDFQNILVLQRYEIDATDRIAMMATELYEFKSGGYAEID